MPIRPWGGIHPALRALDVALCGCCIALAVVFSGRSEVTPGPRWLFVACVCLGAVLLIWRRARPVAVFAVTIGVYVGYFLAFGAPENLGLVLDVTVALFAVGRWEPNRRLAQQMLLWAVFALAVHDWLDPAAKTWHALLTALPYDVLMLCAWLLGAFVRVRGESRAATAARIASQERTRIARELHDIVAHGLGVMVLQAEGAAEIVQRDPARARAAMERVAENGRSSLVELRKALGALRDPDAGELSPQPGLGMLEELLGKVRDSGLQVDLESEGSARPLPAGVDLAAYRVIQEALTNTLRHSRAKRAVVRVRHAARGVDLEICDDGHAGIHAGHGSGHGSLPGGGRGLVGMRERVGLLGGVVDAGPRAEGGFRVAVHLPHAGAR
ncbi:MAG TPA: histidine kinase [Nocardioidaceae bacterium]|nr:histidine kinase [Nocardioidaceae bacterium]